MALSEDSEPLPDPVEQRDGGAEEDEPLEADDVDARPEGSEHLSLGGRPVHVAPRSAPETAARTRSVRLYRTANTTTAKASPTATPGSSPHPTIVAKIASTISHSPSGSVRRASTTQSTRNPIPRNRITPPSSIRGISATRVAPKTRVASATPAAMNPAIRAGTSMRSPSEVRLNAWNPGMPPAAPATRFATPASRSSVSGSNSRRSISSIPLAFRSVATTDTNTTVAIPADSWKTAPQSAPAIARNAHGCHRPALGNGPRSHPPASASAIEEPVTTSPIANTTKPMPSAAGINSGHRVTRTPIVNATAKTSAGSHRAREPHARSSRRVPTVGPMPLATPIPPLTSSQPVPARNPPITGYGTNRTMLPSRNAPSSRHTTPVRTLATTTAATTVRKTRSGIPAHAGGEGGGHHRQDDRGPVLHAPTTPRLPAVHARMPRISAAPTRYNPTPSARWTERAPPKIKAANDDARTISTMPMTMPAVSEASTRPLPRCSVMGPVPVLPGL